MSLRSSMLRRRGIRTLGSGDFSPLSLGGLTAWWTAESLGAVGDGNNVASWADWSGNGFTATQSNETDKPNFVASVAGLNNKPAVFFEATDSEFMDLGSIPIPGSSRNYAVFAAIRTGSAFGGTDWTIFSERNNVDGDPILAQCGGKSTTQNTHDVRADDATGLVRNGATVLSVNTSYVLGFSMDASVVMSAVNGVWGVGTAYTAGTITVDNAVIGANRAGGGANFYLRGHIAELIIYNRLFSASEKSQVDRYLGAKYGITVA